MRVESEETIVVEAHGHNSPIETTITISDFPKKTHVLNLIQARLEPENGMLVSAKVKVPADLLPNRGQNKQYVYVQATSQLFTLEKIVLLSFHSGYIFIQTDKPIYTPGSTVMYRLFTIGHMLDPKIKSVYVEIVQLKRNDLVGELHNSVPVILCVCLAEVEPGKLLPSMNMARKKALRQNLISKNMVLYVFGLERNLIESIEIPVIAVWIWHKFTSDGPIFNLYLLPNFEVILESSQKFFYVDDNELTIDITARYLFGQPVQGQAFALFGVMRGNDMKSIPESLNKVSIQDGKGRAKVTRNMLQSRFPNLDQLLGHSIYVTVTVVTDTGSDMVHAEKSGIHIVRSPYKIIFPKASKFFKPGMPFSLMVSVINPDGSPASQVPVRSVTPAGANSVSREDGVAQLIVNTVPGMSHLFVTVRGCLTFWPWHLKLNSWIYFPDLWLVNPFVVSLLLLSEIPFHPFPLLVARWKQPTSTRIGPDRVQPSGDQTPGGSGNYLHLTVIAAELRSGNTVPVHFSLQNSNPATQSQIRYFTYLILSKGKVVQAVRQPRQTGQNPVIMSLPITPDLIPSFRIVAYYRIGYDEIVADSVWVDVKDTCMGTLKVTGASDQDNREQQPQAKVSLKVCGDPGAKVGLVAVDKAVYVLSKKSKLSQAMIWDTVEKSDIGCTPGGGRDSAGVFVDAGLALQTSSSFGTADKRCTSQVQRRRRSSVISEKKASKAREYQSQFLRKCCEDGMKDNPMGYSCDRRAKYILENKKCIKAFLDCCNHIFDIVLIPETIGESSDISGESVKIDTSHRFFVASSYDMVKVSAAPDVIPSHFQITSATVLVPEPEEEDLEEEDVPDEIVSRAQFAESLLWVETTLPLETHFDGLSSKTVAVLLADSITTWEVLAISLSQTKGICVADPYEIKVKKDFFVDLRLPYSIVRNEQVVIRAVLYNYAPWNFNVLVELVYNEKICSSSSQKKRFRQRFAIQAGTSQSVSYVIIPLELGEVEIEVIAIVSGTSVADGVRKKLRVVPEGMKIFKNIKSILLDPSSQDPGLNILKGASGEQVVTIEPLDLSNIVPNTEPLTFIGVTGNIVGETVENSIDGANLKHLIRVPSGCGEQNMIGLTPAVIATHYLDNTNQWERIGVERRAEAISIIKKGYTQQLAYRKKDSSYAAFTNRPSSTWLTAYVVKVFAMANQLIAIDRQVLCGAVKWLILEKQNPDGIFREDAPVIHGEMVGGGFTGSKPDVSLTSFVVIALQEAKDICQQDVLSLDRSIRKAGDYLAAQLESLQKSYSVAITSYALSLLGRASDGMKLISLLAGTTHWPDPTSKLYTIEATSYGLLALLQLRRFDLASPIVRWLTEQRFYGGGYGSTQATIMVFQALAQYQLSVPHNKDEFLDISIKLPSRSNYVHWRITYENAMVSKTDQTTDTDGFSVSARGTGKGTLSVMAVFYVPFIEGIDPCNKFDLRVSVEKSYDAIFSHLRERSDDSEDSQLFPSSPPAKKPEGALGSVDITICMKFLGEADSTMTIIDISMLTGFTPDINDLQKLTNQVDKYISKFEMDEALSDKGSLILYLDKVSHLEPECLKFKAHQYFEVGLIQPAAVTIYEYYTMENRCTKFYHPSKEGGLLSTVCQEHTCRCMEEKCGLTKRFTPTPDSSVRLKAACETEVDYVYKVYLVEITQKGMYVYYTMKIVQVIKEGSERTVQGKTRQFISPLVCNATLSLEENREYVVWGPHSDMWDLKKEMAYLLTSHTWIELWPTALECQQGDQQHFCQGLYNFVQHMELTGCPH
ncbi:hypothetical protein lerEdw1_002200 [Lerista edwardsae]|nr:hypothetical protein lerEdw1_002200 [Lerista edwardsae]